MDMKTAVETVLRDKYVEFNGRARRAEFWWFILFVFVVSTILSLIDMALFEGVLQDIGPLSAIFTLITLIPAIAVTARRLHDVGRSGWWQLLFLLPVIGFLVILFWAVQKGTDGPNEYGRDPLGGTAPAA
ncbi:uncharacterized membrane protein YhaH (DUF805 family) [Maritimibacter alkaliphilus HTCC2654]|uniref:DUF805 domain-containing protein n=1 Tax=Maritimibacter alkaliphilus HTCC2654 TaxID=314271 RepID=A3VC06_9RHOB|nr:DUF805 domain-containing protein [Maritimibacter alkaliphilus]EAQ14489.1 hypothetical protein RB2654_17506 [Rhodobacterales bacterium HTCC2654] [Maritimibacter alkaliphilus HTCC2654]TYP82420.1 uncharacterized membrane protein YhaH (DUF805 family) [Maritimibacter alkaliphilus HTCC2654]